MRRVSGTLRSGWRHLNGASMLLAVLIAGCSTQISPQELLGMVPLSGQPDEPPPPVPSSQRPDSEANSTRIRAEQVDPDGVEEGQVVSGGRVRQIPTAPDAGAVLSTAIEADDPCLGEMQNTEQCRSTLAPASRRHTASDDGMTLAIVNPETGLARTFDASRAVDEIGRGKTISQGAQSAGSDFLAGANPPPVEPMVPDMLVPDLPPGTVIVPPQ